MVNYITQFYTFWHLILSCLPGPVLTFFYSILFIFIIIIFVKLLLSWL